MYIWCVSYWNSGEEKKAADSSFLALWRTLCWRLYRGVIWGPALNPAGCVTSAKSFNFSRPQLLSDEDSIYLRVLL